MGLKEVELVHYKRCVVSMLKQHGAGKCIPAAALDDIDDILLDVLDQACGDKDIPYRSCFDSEGISAYERGITYLVKRGKLELIPAGRIMAKACKLASAANSKMVSK